jgi:hypothetical protein
VKIIAAAIRMDTESNYIEYTVVNRKQKYPQLEKLKLSNWKIENREKPA